MELDVLTHSHSVLNEHLQDVDKQQEIERYYELLGSGHSVGEILESLNHLQGKSEHGNVVTAERSPSRLDGAAPDVTSEAALMDVAAANTLRAPGVTAPVQAESARTEGPQSTEYTPLNELGSHDWRKLAGKNSSGSESGSESTVARSLPVHTPVGGEIAIPSDNPELRQPGRFSIRTKQFAIGALYTVAVALASIASFAYMSGGPNADPTATRVQSGISSETEAVAIRTSAADGSETAKESLKPTKRHVNANSSSAPQSSRSAELLSAVPNFLQREVPEVSITFPASTSYIGQAVEPGRRVQASATTDHDAVGSGTGRSREVSVPMSREVGGQQIVHAFYTALERADGKAASSLVIPEKREAGPFSAGELSNFYGRLELPLRLIEVYRAGENLFNVAYSYKVKNGRFCNGRAIVRTVSLQNQVLIEGIRSPSRC